MDALTPILEAGAALGVVTTIAFQTLKPFAERLIGTKNSLHDATLQVLLYLVALLLAFLGAVGIAGVPLALSGPSIVSLLKAAGGGWLVALVVYHALTGDFLGVLGEVVAKGQQPGAVQTATAAVATAMVQSAAPAPPAQLEASGGQREPADALRAGAASGTAVPVGGAAAVIAGAAVVSTEVVS